MSYTVKLATSFTKAFKRLNKKYRSLENDVDQLVSQLRDNPFADADLGNGVRKVRMAISDKGRGKSGGARVITYTVKVDEQSGVVTLLTIYDKNEQEGNRVRPGCAPPALAAVAGGRLTHVQLS